MSLNRFITAIIRYQVSDVGAAENTDRSMIINKSKVFTERQKYLQAVTETRIDSASFKAVYFDGRKDDTLNRKYNYHSLKQEDITVLVEPGHQYLIHLTPKSSSTETFAKDTVYLRINARRLFRNQKNQCGVHSRFIFLNLVNDSRHGNTDEDADEQEEINDSDEIRCL